MREELDLTALAPSIQMRSRLAELQVAVLLPCCNEEASIARVVADFRRVLPGAIVFVYDNNSRDGTAAAAAAGGAVVRRAALQGKGNVVRRMFADVDADIYLMADGDGTYDAEAAPAMIRALVDDALDMVSGARVSTGAEVYRRGHRIGNRMLTAIVRQVFGRQFNDMLTGYRVFSRRFVKSFPAHSHGFEIETELTVHTLQMRLPSVEVDTAYGVRQEGSSSKLSTIRDGLRIMRMIGLLVREEKPLQFFGGVSVLAALGSGVLGVPVVLDFLRLGQVPRFPSLIVAVGFGVLALLSFACGLILDTVSRMRLEQRRLAYLALPAQAPMVQGEAAAEAHLARLLHAVGG